MSYGYIKLSRKLFGGSDPLWSEPREFSRAEAWIDLIQMAAWHEVQYRSAAWGADALTRGEFVASVRFLARRWKWGKSRVNRYLEACKKADRIVGRRRGQHGMVYLIVNYDTYQSRNSVSGTADGTDTGTQVGQARDTRGTKTKAGKAGKAVLHSHTVLSRRDVYPPEFEQLWAAYPRRDGTNSKCEAAKAWGTRQREGVAPADMLAGVERYAAWCRASGKVGTEYVKAASSFLGRGRHWEQEWGGSGDGRRLDSDGTTLAGLSLMDAMRAEDSMMRAASSQNGAVPV